MSIKPESVLAIDRVVILFDGQGVGVTDPSSCGRLDEPEGTDGATIPLIKGVLLQPGTRVDLIGAFTPHMRESDDDVVRRATIFVDTRSDGVVAGDLAQPLAECIITLDDIEADLGDLVSGSHVGRSSDDEITMFKSAGFALEDLGAARLVYDVR